MTKNIAKKLIARKSLLDSFFTRQTLDGTSDNCFKNKNGTLLTRTVVYCHDVPGFIAYKMLLENVTDCDKMINVVSMDDGKGMLKITFNWSKYIKDYYKNKLMGPNEG